MSQDVLLVTDAEKAQPIEASSSSPENLSSSQDSLSIPTKSDKMEDVCNCINKCPLSATMESMVLSKTDSPVSATIINGGGSFPFPPPLSVNPLDPVPKFLRIVEGIDKLRRAIGKELVSPNSNEKCSNLPHLLSIAQILLRSSGRISGTGDFEDQVPLAVLKPFNYVPKKTKKTIRFIVDIVSGDGNEWSKISARNPRSLALVASGGGGFGQKSMIDHAKDYIQCAQQHPQCFKPPKIKFIFASGIGCALSLKLESLGVKVEGERIPDSELAIHPRLKPYKDLLYESDSNSEGSKSTEQSGEDSVDGGGHGEMNGESKIGLGDSFSEPEKTEAGNEIKILRSSASASNLIRNPSLEGIVKLNLDITALLAYCSNLTNGHTNVVFKSKILTQQLELERLRPQKPILEAVFRGRRLYCCQMAFKEFKTILETVGGLQEQRRAEELLRRIEVVPDQISERSRELAVVGSIKLRSVTIFGTGDSIQAVTVTANSGFVRSAKSQGIDFPVFLHESRALTEEKENLNSFFASLKSNCRNAKLENN